MSVIFITDCYSNQGKFYKYFDYVILLKAELNVLPLLEKSSDIIEL